MDQSRRQFLGGSLTALVMAPEFAFAETADSKPLAEPSAPPDGTPVFFTPDERLALARMAEHILPGSSAYGVVTYIETLATAFEYDPPRIYAGGPFSGRQPFALAGAPSVPNDFENFLPLNRVQEKSWRLFLYGSDAVPGGNPNEAIVGKVVGLRDLLKDGLAHASQIAPTKVHLLNVNLFGWLWNLLHPAFKNELTELVIEGAYSAPEYGGNLNLEGWKSVHFPGDNLPAGYSTYDPATGTYSENAAAPVTTQDPGPDVDSMSLFTKLLFRFVALVIGRNYG